MTREEIETALKGKVVEFREEHVVATLPPKVVQFRVTSVNIPKGKPEWVDLRDTNGKKWPIRKDGCEEMISKGSVEVMLGLYWHVASILEKEGPNPAFKEIDDWRKMDREESMRRFEEERTKNNDTNQGT